MSEDGEYTPGMNVEIAAKESRPSKASPQSPTVFGGSVYRNMSDSEVSRRLGSLVVHCRSNKRGCVYELRSGCKCACSPCVECRTRYLTTKVSL